MDRRKFLITSTAAQSALWALGGCTHSGAGSADDVLGAVSQTKHNAGVFQHGVASGDPLSDRVILWTRVSPSADLRQELDVSWWVALEPSAASPVRSGQTTASVERDYTVKLDVSGLAPDTSYYFGFTSQGERSAVGRTRTLPIENVEQVRLAVTSCANYPQGYFNAYRDIAQTEDLHAVLSLGDYLYEYANDEYGDGAALDRVPAPNREIVTLGDYRARHAQYKTDVDLQAAHAAHPWIVIWDDHESANDSWQGGAQNHNPEQGEGGWAPRRAAAIKAYYEWMPIREVPTGLFRSFRFGDLADLVMLDTRLEGRDEQVARDDFAAASDPSRTLLGPVQESLFLDHLSHTQSTQVQWKIVGQQVVFAPATDGVTSFNPDSWDGYTAARSRVVNHIDEQGIDNVIILTGDVHSAWAMEVPSEGGDKNHAVEFVTPAVSSPPLASTSQVMKDLVARAESELEHVRYIDGLNNGYLVVEVDHQRARAEWMYTGERQERGATRLGQAVECLSGSSRLVKV